MPSTPTRRATGSISVRAVLARALLVRTLHIRALLVLALVVLALVACSAPSGSVASVTIERGDRSFAVGDTGTLSADVVTTGAASGGDADEADHAVAWSSSDENVATIDDDGTLEALTSGQSIITAASTADPGKSDSIAVSVKPPGTLAWTRQFGSSERETPQGIAVDPDGDVYAFGTTRGAVEGANAGREDTFVRSYDSDGTLRWTRQFGTSSSDRASAIATDTNGDVYAVGFTRGALAGPNAGGEDAFVRSYDSDGTVRWTRQFGTSGADAALGVATDANGDVYVTGRTMGTLEADNAGDEDVFVRSYDRDGTLRWTRQFGTSSNDYGLDIASDANGDVYVTGYTQGTLEGTSAGYVDAYVRSYDRDGTLRWTRQFGTSVNDVGRAIATDTNGNVYASGYTEGPLEGANAGNEDAFVRSYDRDGTLRWTRQFGTPSSDRTYGIAANANGGVYATGYTYGALEGANAGGSDAFVRSYDRNGDLRWTRQFGTSNLDFARAIATDTKGDVYVDGETAGAIVGTSAGMGDVFLRKYGP